MVHRTEKKKKYTGPGDRRLDEKVENSRTELRIYWLAYSANIQQIKILEKLTLLRNIILCETRGV